MSAAVLVLLVRLPWLWSEVVELAGGQRRSAEPDVVDRREWGLLSPRPL